MCGDGGLGEDEGDGGAEGNSGGTDGVGVDGALEGVSTVTIHCSSIYLLTTMWGMDSILAQDPAILIVFWHGLCALPKGI